MSYDEQDNENDRKLVRQKLDLIPPLMNEMQIKQEAIKKKYESLINQVELLPTDLSMDSEKGFIPLKQLSGMNYQKIVGCYIIHNKENNKYYVGQSKDVFKRICRQHFDGTKVKNIIFAEDYFNSQFPNKDDLFEVKIIPLETKDELDQKEKDLIEEYDSFTNGYNGTSGNR